MSSTLTEALTLQEKLIKIEQFLLSLDKLQKEKLCTDRLKSYALIDSPIKQHGLRKIKQDSFDPNLLTGVSRHLLDEKRRHIRVAIGLVQVDGKEGIVINPQYRPCDGTYHRIKNKWENLTYYGATVSSLTEEGVFEFDYLPELLGDVLPHFDRAIDKVLSCMNRNNVHTIQKELNKMARK